MEYKITGFNPYAGSAQVNFFTAEFPEGLTYNVDVPVENGSYISGDALRSHIMAFAPYGQIARIVELRDNPPDVSGIPTGDIIVPPEPLDPVLDATLPEAIAYAEKAIDKGASAARSRFISSGVGQDAVYVVKGEQAQAYAAAGFTGAVPAYVAAEAAATGVTAQAAAETILGLRDAWNGAVGPAIEQQRIGGKKLVRESATVEAVDSSMRAALVALEAIRP
jgi:hypothetical protein